ncbi:Core-2/I-Branching enzyme [Ancylostoma caninum]|uniref:Core-2/I-Branching enzyme n=1 Tax=Ancylostoma caninum TaxID=29170 RepID=A0A368G888_ANCCA|nr:Core-2/I-Branching enzyme [Ancylostoma caninum]
MCVEWFICLRYSLKHLLVFGFSVTFTVVMFGFYAHPYRIPAVRSFTKTSSDNVIELNSLAENNNEVTKDNLVEYVEKIAMNRTKLIPHDIDMSCEGLRRRILPPEKLRPLKPFGVAFARVVYESYEFIEDELRSSYHPQNFFCYSVDSKADDEFNRRIETLQKCFPNVLVTKARFNVNGNGHFMNHAYYECFKLLVAKQGWGYLILMQNYDIMIKSVYETVVILEKLGGANDVHIRQCEEHRWNHRAKWDARSLKLFRDENVTDPEKLNATLTIARGAAHASLSRAAVDWMVNTVDLTKLINQLNMDTHGVDEILLATLQVTEALDMPGRFTSECMKKGNMTGFITRLDVWDHEQSKLCFSKKFRHRVCIFGIEDFHWLSQQKMLMANKVNVRYASD